jgi:hypothetical protein
MKVMKSSMMRWVGYVACFGETTNAYKVLMANPKGEKPLG